MTQQLSTPLGISGRIARFFLHSRLTPLIALVALFLGLFAVLVTPKEEEPQIDVTMANVFIPFPGASVKDVETLVAGPAEQVLSQIQGLEHVYSVSQPGMAVLTVQYKVGVTRTEALVRLWDVIHSNKDWVSAQLGVMEPVIKAKGIDDVPVVALTLSTQDVQRGAYDLERIAHALEPEIKRVNGTREVISIGGPGRVVQVMLDSGKLAATKVATLDVQRALQLANAALPAGQLITDNRQISVETGNYLTNVQEIGQLVVGVNNGVPVYLADVAKVVDGPDQPGRYVWTGSGAASKNKTTEAPAVTLAVTKKPGENAVDVADRVLQRVDELRNSVIPAGVDITLTRNYGETANDKAMKLIQKLIFATASVVALVLIALGRREAVIVGTAVILTLAATLFASWAWGFTLNRVSLFALIFSIGILVDDAIVVVENIHRHQQLERDNHDDDLIPRAVDEVGGPTILATLTVIAALLPMAFVSGLMGPYMSPIPINASMGMLISLAIAFIITPWLAALLLKHHPANHPQGTSKLHRLFARVFRPFLDPVAGGKNRRKLWMGIAAAILLSIGLAGVKLVVLKMLPFDNKSEFQIVVDMPNGTPLENTAAALREMGAYIAGIPEVTHYQAYAGTAAPINFNGLVRQYYLRQASELGDLQVNLLDKHHRSRSSHQIAQSVRLELEKIAARHGARVKVVEVPPGPPVASPIVAEVYGPDDAGRHQVAERVRSLFEHTPDIVGVDDSLGTAAQRLRVLVDQSKAAKRGIAQQQIVTTLRVGLSGLDVTPLHDGQSRYEVPVRLTLPPEKQSKLDDVLKLTLTAPDGSSVQLAELVKVESLARDRPAYHKDLLPVTYVYGDMAGKLDSPLYGMFNMRNQLADLKLPEGGTLQQFFIQQPSDPYRSYALKWDGEWQITYETFRDMGLAYAVGLLLIYVLVVAQFGSYLTPLVIMAPIPLTIIGVMPGHALLGAQFTATSMIGMIALAGIIVRNSILLVDFIDLQRNAGMDFREAVINAASVRAQPIVLTGLAAMIGAFFILDDPIFNGLAISLIFGILVSTVLTLVVIPLLYFIAQGGHRICVAEEGKNHDD